MGQCREDDLTQVFGQLFEKASSLARADIHSAIVTGCPDSPSYREAFESLAVIISRNLGSGRAYLISAHCVPVTADSGITLATSTP
jgi:hypothetical protein